MSMVAVITARGGSKRIPRKNIRKFMGKPMLAYAVEAALGCGIFSEVMVSTDDAEIAETARMLGAAVPFMRSHSTADDFSTTRDVLREVMSSYRERGCNFESLCCVYPCVPFLTTEILRQAYKLFICSTCDALTPVVRYYFPVQRAFRINKNGFLEYREPQNAMTRSQDLEPMYHDVGMFYFMHTRVLYQSSYNIIPFEMDERFIQDIDTPEDWRAAEMKFRIMHNV